MHIGGEDVAALGPALDEAPGVLAAVVVDDEQLGVAEVRG